MKITKQEHKGYKEFRQAKKQGHNIKNLFGRFQYIYSHKGNKISLVFLKEACLGGIDYWEIYCLEGNLFEDVEKFRTKERAITRIKELLK